MQIDSFLNTVEVSLKPVVDNAFAAPETPSQPIGRFIKGYTESPEGETDVEFFYRLSHVCHPNDICRFAGLIMACDPYQKTPEAPLHEAEQKIFIDVKVSEALKLINSLPGYARSVNTQDNTVRLRKL